MFRCLAGNLLPRGRTRRVSSRGPAVVQLPRRAQDMHDGERNGRVGGMLRDPSHDRARIVGRRPRRQAPRRPGLHGRHLQSRDKPGSQFGGKLHREIDQIGHRRVQSLIHQFEAFFFEPCKRGHDPVPGYGSLEADELRVLRTGRPIVVPHARPGLVQDVHRRVHQRLDLSRGPTPLDLSGRQIEPDRSDRPDRVFGAAGTDPLDHQIGDQLGAVRFQPPDVGARFEPIADRGDRPVLVGRWHMLPDDRFDVVEHRPPGPRRRSGAEDPPDGLAGLG